MPLSLTLEPDAVTGRRTFLIGTGIAVLSMFLTWFSGSTLGFFWSTTETSLNGFQCGAWLPLLYTTALPAGFLLSRQAMPGWAKVIAILLYGVTILTESAEALRESPVIMGLTLLRTGGTGQLMFIVAQVVCAIAVFRFPRSSNPTPVSDPTPLES